MYLTPEQQGILNGEKGETMAKVMKTLVMYGDTFGADRMATCGDQNNPDLYNKQMVGKALCLPHHRLHHRRTRSWPLCGCQTSRCLLWILWAKRSWSLSGTA
jgi:hypothetical protein